jgi:hypothetical protein
MKEVEAILKLWANDPKINQLKKLAEAEEKNQKKSE